MNRSVWWKAALGAAAWAAYRYQPQRLCLGRRRPPEIEPASDWVPAELLRPGVRVLIVTAHPDDTEYFIGGTLLRLADAGARLHLIVATDGDKGYYPLSRPEILRQRRREEQRAAAVEWYAEEVCFLGYPDGRLRCSESLIAQIEGELQRVMPEHVILFDFRWPPRVAHRDHLQAGEAAAAAVERSGIRASQLYFATRAPNWFVDISSCWERRLALLDCHPSQWHGGRHRQVRGLITRTAERDGRRIGTALAEGLRWVPAASSR